MRSTVFAVLFGGLLALAGCPGPELDDDVSGDDDAADDDVTGDDDLADDDATGDDDATDSCDFPDPPAALISVSETYRFYEDGAWSDVYSTVRGWLLDGPTPVYHQVVLEEGRCRYLTYDAALCNPPCDWDQYCSPAGECVPRPAGIWGGTLTISGLAQPIEIPPEAGTGTYYGPYPLPDDLFEPQDPIGAELTGDVFPATLWEALGIEDMDRQIAEFGLDLDAGQDTVVTWTPGDVQDACVELWINGTSLGSMAHGMPLDDIIWCIGPDTGSLTVPQSLVETFPPGETPENECFGFDCPKSELIRVFRHVQSTPYGPAELSVDSTVYFRYRHGVE